MGSKSQLFITRKKAINIRNKNPRILTLCLFLIVSFKLNVSNNHKPLAVASNSIGAFQNNILIGT